MTIEKRVRCLRNTLHLSQSAFGEKIGVSKDVIVNLELGRAPVKELMLKMICRTFSVNPLWLERGEGEMFLDSSRSALDDLATEFALSSIETRFIENFLKMTPGERQQILELLNKLIQI